MDALDIFRGMRLVPVVSIERADDAPPLAEALMAAGITSLEITLRTPAALEAIRRVAELNAGIMVGAGSVRRPEQLDAAIAAGAMFAVSPGAGDLVIDRAAELAFPLVPGSATATEMIRLMERGYTLQKFFPAEALGGTQMIRALSAPLPEVRFFPTGGIDDSRLADYLLLDSVVCVGGSFFCPGALITERRFAEITDLARAALDLAHG